jgi:hypothetical protein
LIRTPTPASMMEGHERSRKGGTDRSHKVRRRSYCPLKHLRTSLVSESLFHGTDDRSDHVRGRSPGDPLDRASYGVAETPAGLCGTQSVIPQTNHGKAQPELEQQRGSNDHFRPAESEELSLAVKSSRALGVGLAEAGCLARRCQRLCYCA